MMIGLSNYTSKYDDWFIPRFVIINMSFGVPNVRFNDLICNKNINRLSIGDLAKQI
jgi:hypothetical protein